MDVHQTGYSTLQLASGPADVSSWQFECYNFEVRVL